MQIIVQYDQLGDTWNAWYREHPECSYGGPTAIEALGRLVQLDRPDGYEPAEFDLLEDIGTRLVYELRPLSPDCGRSGTYTGLNAVQKCSTCGGSGRHTSSESMPSVCSSSVS